MGQDSTESTPEHTKADVKICTCLGATGSTSGVQSIHSFSVAEALSSEMELTCKIEKILQDQRKVTLYPLNIFAYQKSKPVIFHYEPTNFFVPAYSKVITNNIFLQSLQLFYYISCPKSHSADSSKILHSTVYSMLPGESEIW